MKISYGITVCDESNELQTLLDHLYFNIDEEDEVIVLRDLGKTNDSVTSVINHYQKLFGSPKFVLVEAHLNNDFASFKNNLLTWATGDYLFQIDADETPNQFLLENIKVVLRVNENVDCFYIPRVNTVNGITEAHIQKWGWRVDEYQRVNYPDPQMRVFKLNGKIKWKNKVHEVLDGYQTTTVFPYDTEDFCLYHNKTIERQEKQNSYYETI